VPDLKSRMEGSKSKYFTAPLLIIRDKHVTSIQFNDGVIQTVTRAAAYVAAAQSVVVIVVIIIKFTCLVLLRDVYMQSAVLAVARWLDVTRR